MPPPNIPASAAPATRGDEDPQSPTVMIQSYLRSKGLPITGPNVQRVLEMNARGDPNNPASQNVVPLPGLVSDVPSVDPAVGGKGNVAGKIEPANTRNATLPTPPVPPDQSTQQTTNQSGMQTNIPLGAMIAAGTGAGLGYFLGGRRGGANTSAQPDTGAAPNLVDRAALAAPSDRAALAGPQTNLQISGPQGAAQLPPGSAMAALPPPNAALPPPGPIPAQTGDRFDVNTGDPLQMAITRATQPAMQIPGPAPMPQIPGQPPLPQLSYQPGVNGAAIPMPGQPGAIPMPAPAPQAQITDQSVLPRPPMPNRAVTPGQGQIMRPDGSIPAPPGGGFRALPRPGYRVFRGLHY